MASSIPPVGPNLQLASAEYDPRQVDQLSKQLRLYMNTVGNASGGSGGGGGSGTGGVSASLFWITWGCN
jgi:hypothetical protein